MQSLAQLFPYPMMTGLWSVEDAVYNPMPQWPCLPLGCHWNCSVTKGCLSKDKASNEEPEASFLSLQISASREAKKDLKQVPLYKLAPNCFLEPTILDADTMYRHKIRAASNVLYRKQTFLIVGISCSKGRQIVWPLLWQEYPDVSNFLVTHVMATCQI